MDQGFGIEIPVWNCMPIHSFNSCIIAHFQVINSTIHHHFGLSSYVFLVAYLTFEPWFIQFHA